MKKTRVQITLCALVHSVHIVAECSPPDGELQYPVRALDEDEGFLSAAVEGGAVDVDELVTDFQLLAQGGLPSVLNLWRGQRHKLVEMQEKNDWKANREAFRLRKGEVTRIKKKSHSATL